MSKQPKLVRVMIAVAILLVASFAAVVVQPSPAQARCAGDGVRVNSRLIVNGTTLVTERPKSGTCNGNGVYQATFNARSGWLARIIVRYDGQNYHYPIAGWTSIGSYSLRDNQGEGAFRITLCATNGSRTYCGWGSNYVQTVSTQYGGWSYGF